MINRLSLLFLFIPVFFTAQSSLASGNIKPIIIGGSSNYPPYEYLDENGRPTGYNIELTRAIAEIMGMDIEIELASWASTRAALETGSVDAIMGIGYSSERAETLDFSPPHNVVQFSIFSNLDAPAVSSLQDLSDKAVVVQNRGIMHDYLQEIDFQGEVVLVDTYADALLSVSTGKQSYVLLAELPALFLLRELKINNLKRMVGTVTESAARFAVKRGNTFLLARFSEGLAILKKTGRYQVIYDKWLGILEPKSVPWTTLLKYGAMFFLPLLLLLIGTTLWSRTLRKQVNLRTAALRQEVLERKRAEEKYRLTTDNISDIVWSFDLTGQFTFVNPAVENILGYSCEEFCRMKLTDIAPNTDVKRIITRLTVTQQDKEEEGNSLKLQGFTQEIPLIHKDGSVVYAECTGNFMKNKEGESIAVIGVARDITERKRVAEELLRQQRQLIQADKMASLGTLVSGVAHEINNPNALFLRNLSVLKKTFNLGMESFEASFRERGDFMVGGIKYSRLRQETPQMFDEMIDGAQRIQRIVDDLKNFARQDDTEIESTIVINEIVSSAVRLLDISIKRLTDHFTVDYGLGLPAIKGNSHRIEQVIINLILNACQALEDKSKAVSLKTYYHKQNDQIIVQVQDEGEGIPAEHMNQLFDPFFTTKRGKGGTGLGLSISSEIVKNHGGSLEFHSTSTSGTTATLALPVNKKRDGV